MAPLALAQFVASFAATTMTVSISAIADGLATPVSGVQATITLFTLVMAALMVPGGKLTDVWGRKRCFTAGLAVYGAGALVAALAPGPWVLLLGYSVLEGVGSALMIPPVYVLVTVLFGEVAERARAFAVVSAAGGVGAAAGPLLGGLLTSAFGWRTAFLFQVAVVAAILVAARGLRDPGPSGARGDGPPARFDVPGAVLSGTGLFLVVLGVLRSGWVFVGLGVLVLGAFGWHITRRRDPLCPPELFRDARTVLGLATQVVQWLVLQGAFIVLSVYAQRVRGLDAVGSGLALAPVTAGVLVAAAVADRLARRLPLRRVVRVGFAVTVVGVALLVAPVRHDSGFAAFLPGLLLGTGVGTMLTASVTLVQSAWPPPAQGAVSGVSRAVSNLGSSLGTALAGAAVAATTAGPYASALAVFGGLAVVGFGLALLLPRQPS
ncbi:MFS transporter [Saccharothrix mutabilis subsp. mutabilis]|uniref:MFS transporter n=1 Tax=Saccharothrix mutabilis subsp. mutabilis TaxID=66855 RepID=A0ABN0UM86_9PSEU